MFRSSIRNSVLFGLAVSIFSIGASSPSSFVDIAEPIKIRPESIPDGVVFRVTKDLGDRYAITVEGDWKRNPRGEDRFDGGETWRPIILECRGLSRGVLLNRIDNADVGQILVTESRGEAIEICSCRQTNFSGSVRAHRCRSARSIILFSGDGYGSNMLSFSYLEAMGCDSPVTIKFVEGEVNQVRLVSVSMLVCHPVWQKMREQFPYTKTFGHRLRTHLDLGNSTGISILCANFRMDRDDLPGSKAIVGGDKSCVVTSGQILQRRGEDWKKLTDGRSVVFPGMSP